ncbi:MAG: hypothetical protein NC548_31090 [Lachnospiraceae bacterium]|nr:hypothetical protein [Lachnospiraceae bacterium]MCM1232060.1 hypothetical protein [Ruminococcus flavefaciens]
MAKNIFKSFANGGGFSLPYLLHIHDDSASVYVINDSEDLDYGGHTYKASNFTYTPGGNGDSNLEIELVEANEIIDIMENNYFFHVEVIGVFYDGEVTETSQFRHMYGEGTWDGKSLQMKLNKDDRLDMTFPALIFNSYNNRGNS